MLKPLLLFPSSSPHNLINLQLTPSAQQLGARTRNSQLTRLLNLSLEHHRITGLPHLGNERLTREHNTRKADLDVLERSIRLQHVLAADAKGAQAVQDGRGEAADLGEHGVDVQWVEVAREAVDGGLLFGRLLLDDGVRCALGRLVALCRCATVAALLLAAEVASAADEDCALVVENLLAGFGVFGDRAVYNEAGCALVDDLDELGNGNEFGFGRDGEFSDLEILLSVKKHAGVEVGDNVVKAEGCLGVKRWDYTKCGNDLEILITLKDEWKVGALCANTKV